MKRPQCRAAGLASAALVGVLLGGCPEQAIAHGDGQGVIAGGPALRVLQDLSRRTGLPLAVRQADLAGVNLPALVPGRDVIAALAPACRRAGLECRLVGGGLVVRRASRIAARRPLRASPISPLPQKLAGESIVVAGRRGLGGIEDSARSFSLTAIDGDDLRRRSPQSLAEWLGAIPGVWVDTSAGTSANTIRVRGIPFDGYQAISVQEDGLAIQHASLPWTDVDQFVRPDIMLEGSDYVRGGPAAVLGAAAPGGMLDLHVRRAPAKLAGEAMVTTSGRGLARIEGWIGGPLGGWRVIGGGFLASDPTVRRLVNRLGGGQLRLGAEHEGAETTLRLGLRWQDDASLNTSSFPLAIAGNRLEAVPGFDPRRDSWFGASLANVRFATAQGSETRDIARNNQNRLADLSASLVWRPAPATRIEARARLRHSQTERNAILSGGAPVTVSDYLAANAETMRARWPGLAGLELRRADGSGLSDSSLVEVVQPASAQVTLDEAIGEGALIHGFEAAGHHTLTLGLHLVASRWRYERIVARALVEARGQPQTVDLVALDGAGAVMGSLTDGAFLSRASTWEWTQGTMRNGALFLADEWQWAADWRLDLGLRHEVSDLSGWTGVPETVDLSDTETLAGRSSQLDSGARVGWHRAFAGTNATLALDWHRPGSALGAFARVTHGQTLPTVGAFRTSANPASAHVVNLDEHELGVIHERASTRFALTLFANRFDGLDVSASTIDAQTGAITIVPRTAASHTTGFEAEARVRAGIMTWRGTFTWQRARLSGYRFTDASSGIAQVVDNNGHVPQRVPDIMATAGCDLSLAQGRLGLEGDLSAMGRRFADDGNSLRLPGFMTVGLHGRASLGATTELSGEVSNLFDVLAVMQGDAIAGTSTIQAASGQARYAVGRALAGRTFMLHLRKSW